MGFTCGICGATARLWNVVDGVKFTDCARCDSIAMEADQLALVDAGNFERKYDDNYWCEELSAAKERSWGASVARAAEAILLCRRPVARFIDVATGPGYLLDALSFYLPSSSNRFFGVEKFPPATHSAHPGFIEGAVGELGGFYDCGVCIETIEHLTPNMLKQLVRELASISEPRSFFIFNTGLSAFVRDEDPGYIDPLRRGHIVSWGRPALAAIFGPAGFVVHEIGNRDWAFAIEYRPELPTSIDTRLWEPLDENRRILDDPETGAAMMILARESLRADKPRSTEPQVFVPIFGRAKTRAVRNSLFADGWMSDELSVDLELRDDVTAITANLWFPDDQSEPVDICLKFGEVSAKKRMVPGMNEIKLEGQHPRGSEQTLSLVASATFSAAGADARNLSVVVDSIVLSR